MASYWITVHWPHPAEDDHPWDVYLRKDREADGYPLAIGDKVFFYQTMTVYGERPTTVRRLLNGEWCEVPLSPGAGAIVRLAEVVRPMADLPPGYVRYDYGDGGTAEWKKHVRCGHFETGHSGARGRDPKHHPRVEEAGTYLARLAPNSSRRVCRPAAPLPRPLAHDSCVARFRV